MFYNEKLLSTVIEIVYHYHTYSIAGEHHCWNF